MLAALVGLMDSSDSDDGPDERSDDEEVMKHLTLDTLKPSPPLYTFAPTPGVMLAIGHAKA